MAETHDAPSLAAQSPDDQSPTAIERAVCDIWVTILQDPNVGIDDDFLSLGGDSLQATLVLGQIARTLGVNVPISLFFGTCTVRTLAEYIDMAQSDML
jgi:acyl carrier protein